MCGNMGVEVLGSGRVGHGGWRRENLCGALGGDDEAGGRGEGDPQGKYVWGKETTPVGEEKEERG